MFLFCCLFCRFSDFDTRHHICLLLLMFCDIPNLINHVKHLSFKWVLRSSFIVALPVFLVLLYSATITKDEPEIIYSYVAESPVAKNINLTALWSHHEPLSASAALRHSNLAANGLQLCILCASSTCPCVCSSVLVCWFVVCVDTRVCWWLGLPVG